MQLVEGGQRTVAQAAWKHHGVGLRTSFGATLTAGPSFGQTPCDGYGFGPTLSIKFSYCNLHPAKSHRGGGVPILNCVAHAARRDTKLIFSPPAAVFFAQARLK